MANDLTGGFDVVAQFSAGAVNRVLAAMHRGGRLQHSLSMRVDNTPRSRGSFPVAGVFGQAVTSRMAVSRTTRGTGFTGGLGSPAAVARLLTEVLDPLVNVGGIYEPPPVANPLHGVAQLQLGAPTITLPSTSHSQATVHLPLLAQYFPDQDSTPLPRFLSGELQIAFAATEVISAAGKFIHVDLAQAGGIRFLPSQVLDPDSLATIDSALKHAMNTAFEPSNTAVPSSLTGLRIFTLPQNNAVAVLMNLPGGQPPPGPPQNFNSVFLNPADQFALAISSDFLGPTIARTINSALDPHRHIHIRHDTDLFIGTLTVYVDVSIGQASVEFRDGSILLEVVAHVHLYGDLGSHHDDVTLRQAFTLNLMNGQVHLALFGDLDVDNSSTLFSIADWISGAITNRVRSAFSSAWNNHQGEIQGNVSSKVSSSTLQGFLKQLMNPSIQQTPPPEVVNPTLTFTSLELRKAGVVLHGALAVPPWPSAHADFDLVTSTATMQHPEYNALNSWIPGGLIQSYVWSYSGHPTAPDATKFVSSNAPALDFAPVFRSVCVKVQGARISASGPIVMQPVSNEVCHGLTVGATMPSSDQPPPDIGVTGVAGDGKLAIMGHVSPWVRKNAGTGTVNLLVHFPDDHTLPHLAELRRAVTSSGRKDADTAIVGVLAAGQLEKVRNASGLALADDAHGWEQFLKVTRRPATVLVGPFGKELWRQDGDVTPHDLAEALKKNLSSQSYFAPQLARLPLQTGHRPPNFVFEHFPGRQVTLRKLAGQRVILAFVKSGKASVDTLEALEKAYARMGPDAPVVLAIDGSNHAIASTHKDLPKTVLIPDLLHRISCAYGVSVWPTVIEVGPQGTIQDIHYGLITESETPAKGNRDA